MELDSIINENFIYLSLEGKSLLLFLNNILRFMKDLIPINFVRNYLEVDFLLYRGNSIYI